MVPPTKFFVAVLAPLALVGSVLQSTASAASGPGISSVGANEVVSWGLNSNGQFGNGTLIDDSLATPALGPGGAAALAFAKIAASGTTVCGLLSTGTAYCWGRNSRGQLGNNTTIDQPLPTAVLGVGGGPAMSFASIETGQHTCALDVTGAAYCWGYNQQGQLGDGTKTDSSTPLAVIGPPATFASIHTGSYHTCALTSTGAAYCWGTNNNGQLGTGTGDVTSPTAVLGPGGGAALAFASLAMGRFSTCGVATDGAAYCWGRGGEGQLGDAGTASSGFPVAVSAAAGGAALTFTSIEAGRFAYCGLSTTGAAYCWGLGTDGQLGNDATTNASVPVSVVGPAGGAALSYSAVSMGGGYHACGVALSGAAYCWGRNSNGQLGDGTIIDSDTPVMVAGGDTYSRIAVGSDSVAALVGSGGVSPTPAPTPAPVPVVPPSAPSDVVVESGVNSVTVSWQASASPGTYEITHYQAIASPGNASCLTVAPQMNCAIDGLTAQRSYRVSVRALSGAGWGAVAVVPDQVSPIGESSILISGWRSEVSGRPGIRVSGVTTGMDSMTVAPWVKLSGQTSYRQGVARRSIADDGSFTWQRRTGKKIHVYFATIDGSVQSERIVMR